MIQGAGTLNASGAFDAPAPEPVDPGFTHSLFKKANAYVLSAVREEGCGDYQRAFRSYSRAIDEFIKGLQRIPSTPEYKAEKEDIKQRTEEYLAHAEKLKQKLELRQRLQQQTQQAAAASDWVQVPRPRP